MVSLTSLLVLVSLFSDTTDKIPKTSYMKLIDIWFMSVIVLDFLTIAVVVVIEHYRQKHKIISQNIYKTANKKSLSNCKVFQGMSKRLRHKILDVVEHEKMSKTIVKRLSRGLSDENVNPSEMEGIQEGRIMNILNTTSMYGFPIIYILFLATFITIAVAAD